MRSSLLPSSAIAIAALACTSAFAQGAASYPDHPVRIVIPFPAAGGTDIVGRALAAKLGAALGQAMVIDNRVGGSSVVGTNFVAKAPADGYTLLYTSSNFTGNPALLKNLPFDTLKDFAPVCLAAFHPFVLLASADAPFNNVRELVAYAKANPGKLNYASAGNGSSQHVSMEQLKRMAGVDITHIPYKGSQDMATDLITGRVSIMFNGISPTLGFLRSGKMKALAVDSTTRVGLLPEVPTIDESGVPGFSNVTWSGLLAPAGTPRPVIDKLNAACAGALNAQDLKASLVSMGLQPSGWGPAQFADFLRQDVARWTRLVEESGAKVD